MRHGFGIFAHTDECGNRIQARHHLFYAIGQIFMVDERFAFGEVHHVTVILGPQEHGQRDPYATVFRQCILAKNIFRTVGHEKSNLVSLFQAEVLKCRRQAVGFVSHLGIGVGDIAISNGCMFSIKLNTSVVKITYSYWNHFNLPFKKPTSLPPSALP